MKSNEFVIKCIDLVIDGKFLSYDLLIAYIRLRYTKYRIL